MIGFIKSKKLRPETYILNVQRYAARVIYQSGIWNIQVYYNSTIAYTDYNASLRKAKQMAKKWIVDDCVETLKLLGYVV